MKSLRFLSIAALSALAFTANAGKVITTGGGVSLGIQDLGALGFSGVGINRAGLGDAITPGCLCEGWGASLGGTVGWSANDNGGNANVSLVSFGSTLTTATSIVNVGGAAGLQVTQAYGPSASNALIKNHVTLTNKSGASAPVRYSRSMDWDIPPTPFSERVTIGGVGNPRLIFSNDNGFRTPNPLFNPGAIRDGTNNANFTDVGPGDLGAYFTFDLGVVAAGQSVSFDMFYGAAGSEVAAFSALGAVGAKVYSLGQNSVTGTTDGTPGTFIFGFADRPPGLEVTGTLSATGPSAVHEFHIDTPGSYKVTLIDNGLFVPFDELGVGVTRTGGATLGSMLAPGSFVFDVSVPGSYTAVVGGVAGFGAIPIGTYGLTIALVPEAQTWLLMLVGMSLLARQRRSQGSLRGAARYSGQA